MMRSSSILAAALFLVSPGLPASSAELVAQGPAVPRTYRPLEDPFASVVEEARHMADALRSDGRLPRQSSATPTFIWPLRQISSIEEHAAWVTVGFVDHDARYPGYIVDYWGGNRTYDLENGYNHAGTDTVAWPFGWAQKALGQVEIVAAAAGTVVIKQDGNFDAECEADFDEEREANAVVLQHSDGSMSVYGHLKSGSLTTRGIGEAVAEGEYLGLNGSSGYSGYPHLHFEVYDRNERLIDPFAGPHNNMNSTSWWQDQPPYEDPALLRVMTHSREPETGSCRRQERTHAALHFQPGDEVFLASYHRDLLKGQKTGFAVLKPDGTTFDSWTHKASDRYLNAAYFIYSVTLPDSAQPGTWIFEADDGETLARASFEVGSHFEEPVVLKVRPGRIPVGATRNVKIKGKGFPPGLAPDIQASTHNEKSIKILRSSVRSKRVTLKIRVAANALPGFRDIVLTAPDYSQIVITDAFEIVP